MYYGDKNWGKIGDGVIGLSPKQNFIKKLQRYVGARTDTRTQVILWSVPCYAIAMGRINISRRRLFVPPSLTSN